MMCAQLQIQYFNEHKKVFTVTTYTTKKTRVLATFLHAYTGSGCGFR